MEVAWPAQSFRSASADNIKPLYKKVAGAFAALALILTPIIGGFEEKVETVEPVVATTTPVIAKVELIPALRPICSCESTGVPNGIPKQFNADGTVLRGRVNPRDKGMCQISETYWLEESRRLGYDIDTEDGNIRMANYIYEKYGNTPWKWSRSCWDKAMSGLSAASSTLAE